MPKNKRSVRRVMALKTGIAALLSMLAVAGCHGQSARPGGPPSAKEEACARAFKLDPSQPEACAARHGSNCFASTRDACACAGCKSCMVLESFPPLVSCGAR